MKTMTIEDDDVPANEAGETNDGQDTEALDTETGEAGDVEDRSAEAGAEDESPEGSSEADAPLTFEIEGHEPGEQAPDDTSAPNWLRDLRRRHREVTEQNKAYARELEAVKAQLAALKPSITKEPAIEDFNFDPEAYADARIEWKQKQDEAWQREAAAAQKFQAQLAEYATRAKALGVPDFAEAEGTLIEALHPNQLRVLMDAANEPEKVVYALAKNPGALVKMAAETNLVRFSAEVARLEGKITVARKTPPPPEKRVANASASGALSSQAKLDRLRADAERTGDYVEYFAYKRKLNEKVA